MKVEQRTNRPTRHIQTLVVLCGCALFVCSLTLFPTAAEEPVGGFEVVEAASEGQDFSKFQHSNPMHSRLPCLVCHKREAGVIRLKLPGHIPCSSCHVQQFADASNPMCTICHTNPGTGAVKGFPGLKSFNARFDHGRHQRQTNCATCHKPSRAGVALSVPAGGSAHATCFTCHGPQTNVGGQNIGSCGTCHQPGRPSRASDWAKAFSYNFNHREHVGRKNLNCSSCHTVRAGAGRGRQVTSPVVSMHFARANSQSCGACHNSQRAFGTSDFANCKRCHEGRTFRF
jgi:c(7)-type cytochrome triheme protein